LAFTKQSEWIEGRVSKLQQLLRESSGFAAEEDVARIAESLEDEKQHLYSHKSWQISYQQSASKITGRALIQSLNAWEKLSINQIIRGLQINKNGVGRQSLSGHLGGLNHLKAISKIDSTWIVTDKDVLRVSACCAGFANRLFPPEGVLAMKKRAHLLAKSKGQNS
jgi:hypothetical protein